MDWIRSGLFLAITTTVYRAWIGYLRAKQEDYVMTSEWWDAHIDMCADQAAYCLHWAEDEEYPVEARAEWVDCAQAWAEGWKNATDRRAKLWP